MRVVCVRRREYAKGRYPDHTPRCERAADSSSPATLRRLDAVLIPTPLVVPAHPGAVGHGANPITLPHHATPTLGFRQRDRRRTRFSGGRRPERVIPARSPTGRRSTRTTRIASHAVERHAETLSRTSISHVFRVL